MSAKACSDEEFIGLWHIHHSHKKVAEALKINVRSVAARRENLQNRHGIVLPLFDPRPSYDQSMLVTADRVEVKLKLKSGVILVAGDQHFVPGYVPTMHRAFIHLSKKFKPFAQIWNGDAFDGASISRFASIGWEKKPTVSEELDTVKERTHEVVESSPNSKRGWNLGNHDMRYETRLAEKASEYRNVKGIHLKDHFPEWTPAWFVTVNEGEQSHTEIRHREKGGIHASYNNTVSAGVNIVTGHDHVADVKAFDDRRGRRYGVRHGMTADSSRDAPFVNYLEGRKTNWQSAVAVLTYKDGVLLQPELALRVDENHFQFRGEIIRV